VCSSDLISGRAGSQRVIVSLSKYREKYLY
jgi:hypothetical protein